LKDIEHMHRHMKQFSTRSAVERELGKNIRIFLRSNHMSVTGKLVDFRCSPDRVHDTDLVIQTADNTVLVKTSDVLGYLVRKAADNATGTAPTRRPSHTTPYFSHGADPSRKYADHLGQLRLLETRIQVEELIGKEIRLFVEHPTRKRLHDNSSVGRIISIDVSEGSFHASTIVFQDNKGARKIPLRKIKGYFIRRSGATSS